ncbi:MAG: hypothetical protein IBX45_06825 [Campylobacterales bacterium]|nr:hypothetical protein [Campylobacterales bacterium]
MREVLMEIFGNFSRWIILLHIVTAMLLVGSLVVIRFVVKPTMEGIEHEKERLSKGLELMRRYAYFVVPAMLVMIVTSVFMSVGLGFKYGDPTTYNLIHTKEALWVFIAFNFVYMVFKYKNAKKAILEDEFVEVQENLILMLNYLIPLNAVLGIIGAYLGIVIRGH